MKQNACLTLDLEAVQANVKQALNQSHHRVIAVVKNDAYHFGLIPTVTSMVQAGIRFFATTAIQEAIQIKTHFPDVQILVINPSTDFDRLRQYDLHASLPSLAYFETYQDQMHHIHWHLEWAGLMRRSGCRTVEEAQTCLKRALAQGLDVCGLWTHFAWADELEGDYDQERGEWLSLRETLSQVHHFDYIHAQNSASFVRESGPFYPGDYVRLGIYLYGCLPYAKAPVSLQHALTLEAQVISIQALDQGESIGYSGAYQALEGPVKVAVINVGYGDGLLRSRVKKSGAQEGHIVHIKGQAYHLMSLMMSHCLALVDDLVQVGDRVVLYDAVLPVHYFTQLGVGANSEQIAALNHQSLEVVYK
ncbi:TPA: alanine racemase [Streptococcus suis]